MNTHNSQEYAVITKLLHWLMALAFIFMWACGYAMKSLVEDDSPLEDTLFSVHISVGVILLFLMVARILVRFTHPAPPLPEGFTAQQAKLSHLGHLGLYLLPLTVIIIGWAEVDFGGHGVTMFGIDMPKVFPTLETWMGVNLEEATSEAHEILAYTFLALFIVHVAAVVKHRMDGHDILYRMTLKKRA